MAKGKEIETKWYAENVKRADFSAFMFDQLKKIDKTEDWSFLTVKGPDAYWTVDSSFADKAANEIYTKIEGCSLDKADLAKIIKAHYPRNVMRHRVSPETNELTTKARLIGEDGIKVRYEYNIALDAEKNTQKNLEDWLKLNNHKKEVTLVKDCDIFFIDYPDGAKVHTVWYEVYCKGHEDQIFVEVEVEGATEERSFELLEKWSNLLRHHLKLTNDKVSPNSLYEIYTGNKYKEV